MKILSIVHRRAFSSYPHSATQIESVATFLDRLGTPELRVESSLGSTFIHPTAIVHPDTQIAPGVQIGPYCIVGPDVQLKENVVLKQHVVVDGATKVGANTIIFPFASIGGLSQDKKHNSSLNNSSSLEIGSNCVIREHVTINCGTNDGTTRVGDDCWILATSHIGHDSQVGNRVVISNATCLAGHVHIDDMAIIGGQVGIKQFVRIGRLAMIGGKSAIDGDVVPYGLAIGNRAKIAGLNLVGLRRLRVARSEIKALLQTYRYVFGLDCQNSFAPSLALSRHESIVERAKEAKAFHSSSASLSERLEEMIEFVEDSPKRERSTLCTPH
ncbi:acyl-,acyl-carrier-protein-UDP-N-acetylglucosamine O-acyltransferase [Thraustotheca clavata]|uniref:Acyl-, acyl-carrier-protein-UDP-N-acetylglucosamine O-acyltransferase n=1 Tax=Thraustotheca clavata TaxID=74557 RepID=A0A1V9ZQ67_9STRA|nr:acyl-,acyl-carrier-protein-UDP-N-acetylglucosamine O-acyltransferase [Thraustotheca clavata]